MDNNSCDTFTLYREYDIMNLDEVLNILQMKKRIQQAKALHPYEIHHTEKSGYFTVVDDDTAPTGKKKIRKCSEEKLWDALAEWYLDNSDRNLTLVKPLPIMPKISSGFRRLGKPITLMNL